MADPVNLRQLTAFDNPAERVTLLLGDGPDAERSNQWISAQVAVDMQPMKSHAWLRVAALTATRDLIDAEIRRLSAIYSQAERARG